VLQKTILKKFRIVKGVEPFIHPPQKGFSHLSGALGAPEAPGLLVLISEEAEGNEGVVLEGLGKDELV
jgi:hypothetical protein